MMLKTIVLVVLVLSSVAVGESESEGREEGRGRGRGGRGGEEGGGEEEERAGGEEGGGVEETAESDAEAEGGYLNATGAPELPKAEKFFGLFSKVRTPQDEMRDRMIGMVFTGKPEPLGYRPQPSVRQISRRRYQNRDPHSREREPQYRAFNSPREILKPMSFVPRPGEVQFMIPMLDESASNLRPRLSHPPFHDSSFGHPDHHDLRGRQTKPFHEPHDQHFEASKGIFSNNVGPDFGPVTFNEFGSDFQSQFDGFGDVEKKKPFSHSSHRPKDPFLHTPKRPAESFTHSTRPEKPFLHSSKRPQKPFSHTPRRPLKPHLKRKPSRRPQRKPDFKPTDVGSSFSFSSSNFGGGFSNPPRIPSFPRGGNSGECMAYTEDICLDTDNYPHEEILTSLAIDPVRSRTLMAEVRDQSADELVDGITAAQEVKYDYAHYFGNRRKSPSAAEPELRDFASEGGYLCPSEVKYARPKKARNSKKDWKFIVNMDKYSQTIRMEKCMKPGGSCSYVSHHYRATCNQIYNYHRLLSWEKKRGLHMDIYKVPSCCTCHIQGYAYVFPPLRKNKHRQDSSASEVTQQVVPSEQEHNNRAPPFSPVNFPNFPTAGRSGTRRERPTHMRGKTARKRTHANRSPSPTGAVNRSDGPEHRVNYDYHPIIDFFSKS